MFLSILTFEFDLILGYFFWSGSGSITVLGSTHVVEQFSYSTIPPFMTFEFDTIFGSFLTFWGPNGLFLGWR